MNKVLTTKPKKRYREGFHQANEQSTVSKDYREYTEVQRYQMCGK